MNNNKLIASFTGFALLAIVSTLLVFQSTTFTGQTGLGQPLLSRERFLARENCNYLEAPIDLKKEDCEKIGNLECEQLYGTTRVTHHGDVYDYTYRDCRQECKRDVRSQCQYASSSFEREGLR